MQQVITQNIDGLYQKTGLPSEMITEFHGSMDGEVIKYGDSIPLDIVYRVEEHMEQADMVIVMGTSLQVAPFCAIPNMLNKHGIRILVDIQPQNTYVNHWSKQRSILDMDSGFYPHAPVKSWTKFGRRTVTLRPLFGTRYKTRKKWPNQYVYQVDCDVWSNGLMNLTL